MQHQNLLDLQDGAGFGSNPKSWLTGEGDEDLRKTLSTLSAAAATASATGNVDRVLFNDLVEMVPLVQSLIDRTANTSLTRRGSMVYTKKPSRESLQRKLERVPHFKEESKGTVETEIRTRTTKTRTSQYFQSQCYLKKIEKSLRHCGKQVEDLKKQLSEKDERLKSAELTKNEIATIRTKFDELKNEAADKDSLIKSSQLQLSDAKIKLADKQAAVERLQWEAMTSNKKVEKLQEDLDKLHAEISSFMLMLQGLTTNDSVNSTGDYYDDVSYPLDDNPGLDPEMDMQKLEATREAYIAAVASAREKQDEASIAAAASARFHLQSFVLRQTACQ